MLITMHKFASTNTWDRYNIAYGDKLVAVSVRRPKPKHRIQSMRNAIREATGGHYNQLTFLGNSKQSGKWVTEWMMQ